MRTMLGRKLEMLKRVRVFSRAHPSDDAGYGKILGELEALLGQAEALEGVQRGQRAAATNARTRRNEIRRTVHFQLLRYLVAVGSVAAKDREELALQFKLPDVNAGNDDFAGSVRLMLAVAQTQKESLVRAGMVPELLDKLAEQLAGFEAASDSARTSKLGHMGARRSLELVFVQLTQLVRLLDGINRWRFAGNPDVLDSWNAAKYLGPRRQAPSEGETPAGSGGVAPAA